MIKVSYNAFTYLRENEDVKNFEATEYSAKKYASLLKCLETIVGNQDAELDAQNGKLVIKMGGQKFVVENFYSPNVYTEGMFELPISVYITTNDECLQYKLETDTEINSVCLYKASEQGHDKIGGRNYNWKALKYKNDEKTNDCSFPPKEDEYTIYF